MKKTYINPQMNIVNLDAKDVICTSPKSMSYGGKSNNGVAEGRSRGNSIWDDEE